MWYVIRSENNVGNWILEKIEANTLEMVELEEKVQRSTKAVYKEVFKFYRFGKNGITQLLLSLSTILRMLPQPRSLKVTRRRKLITVAPP